MSHFVYFCLSIVLPGYTWHTVSPSSAFPSCEICGVQLCRQGWQAISLARSEGCRAPCRDSWTESWDSKAFCAAQIQKSCGVRDKRAATFSLKIRGKICIESSNPHCTAAGLLSCLWKQAFAQLAFVILATSGLNLAPHVSWCGPMILLCIAEHRTNEHFHDIFGLLLFMNSVICMPQMIWCEAERCNFDY